MLLSQSWTPSGTQRRCQLAHPRLPRAAARRVAAATAVQTPAASGQLGSLPHGSARRQGPRETMEDYVAVQQAQCGFLFAAVYDGHNGDAAAQWLTKNLLGVFEGLLQEQQGSLECQVPAGEVDGVCCPITLHGLLSDTFNQADEQLLQWMQGHGRGGEPDNSGCTATAALIRKDAVIVANVGDSRAVLCRDGQAINLTTEHRVFGRGEAVKSETQRIQEVGGWVDDGRVCGVLAVSRAFGDPEFKGKGLAHLLHRGVTTGLWTREFADSRQFSGSPVIAEPDVTELALGEIDEFIIVATDGLWDVMGSQDVVNLARTNLRKGVGPQELAEKLADVALKRYTSDNVAVVVVSLKDMATGSKAAAAKSGGGGKKGGLFGLFQ